MPYQDNQPAKDGSQGPNQPPSAGPAQQEAANAKTIQIFIAIGLVAAILVAVFGSY